MAAVTGGTITIVIDPIVIVFTSFVVSEMTTRTIGLVSRRLPDHYIRIGLMAVGAIKIAAVIQRFIA